MYLLECTPLFAVSTEHQCRAPASSPHGPMLPSPFVENYFSIEQSWYPCQKPIYHKGKGLFLDSQLCCLMYTSIHLLARHSLDYTSFVVSFQMGSMSPPTSIYCSRFYWLLLGLLHFHMNFRTSLSISAERQLGFRQRLP